MDDDPLDKLLSLNANLPPHLTHTDPEKAGALEPTKQKETSQVKTCQKDVFQIEPEQTYCRTWCLIMFLCFLACVFRNLGSSASH